MRLTALSLLTVFLITMVGCRQRPRELPLQTVQVDKRLVEANNAFGLKLLRKLCAAQPAENVFISPTSIGACLAMLDNGAAGKTRVAIEQTLGVRDLELEDINRSWQGLNQGLQSTDQVQLAVANSLWGDDSVRLRPDFIKVLGSRYDAKAASLDFQEARTAKRINAWVSEKTHQHIKQIVTPAELLDHPIILLSAVWFKGGWAHPFKRAETRDHPFSLPDGTQKTVRMMSRKELYQYAELDGVQVVALPYKGQHMMMLVALPPKTMELGAFLALLTPERSGKWIAQVSERTSAHRGTVKLPRFEVAYLGDLVDALRACGMGGAFAPDRADFSLMSDAPVWLGPVRHRTLLQVDEKGTEATGVTIATASLSAGPRPTGFEMTVDHPFFCAIWDKETQALVFAGMVVDPEGL